MTKYPYGPSFWWTYLANIGLMVAVSLLFRYADFVAFLGGTEMHLGFITGLGMFGAITARCFQGIAIDRYGPTRIWMLSLGLLIICLLSHLAVGSLQPPLIHVLRVLYTVCLAGAFGASITYISLRAPTNRMAEMIGVLGSSGFVGMAIGPVIGDWLFAGTDPSQGSPLIMFTWAAGAVAVSLVCTWLATRATTGSDSDSPRPQPPIGEPQHSAHNPIRIIWRRVRAYHPGWTLLVGVAMGIGIGMPGTFLRTFAVEKGFTGLRHFFLTYAIVAFVVRICTRKLADRWGSRPTIVLGLLGLATSMVAYNFVTSQLSLIIPAVFAGVAHAFLFPAAVAEASHSFPRQYRGLATNLILTMFDVGLLIGQPAIGLTVELARAWGWDGYFIAFSGLALLMLSVALIYGMGKTSVIADLDPQAKDPNTQMRASPNKPVTKLIG